MARPSDGLSPAIDHLSRVRIQRIVAFWNEVQVCEETGSTSWEALEPLEREVTECLSRDPPDIDRAESQTAKAMFLIVGQDNF
jgi:hypothetical protein